VFDRRRRVELITEPNLCHTPRIRSKQCYLAASSFFTDSVGIISQRCVFIETYFPAQTGFQFHRRVSRCTVDFCFAFAAYVCFFAAPPMRNVTDIPSLRPIYRDELL
jgi:hypothetical protein